jgi:hypothetical protein
LELLFECLGDELVLPRFETGGAVVGELLEESVPVGVGEGMM